MLSSEVFRSVRPAKGAGGVSRGGDEGTSGMFASVHRGGLDIAYRGHVHPCKEWRRPPSGMRAEAGARIGEQEGAAVQVQHTRSYRVRL
jgi:hypothetical protein